MIIRRHRTTAYYLEKIEKEIRERVIHRERELREEREQRLWEHSTIEALQAVTEFVPDEEVESIATAVREKWEIEGGIHGREELIEKEIRESVIKREMEIGREKERKQREQSQLEALKEITDFVSAEEIDKIASEVREKYRAKIEAIERKAGFKNRDNLLSGKALKEILENRKKLMFGNALTAVFLFFISTSFWSRPEELYSYLYWILPFILIITFGFIKQRNYWHLLIFYPLWALFYLVVGLTFIKPTIMDSKSWVNHKAAERLIDPINRGDIVQLTTLVENGAGVNVNRAGNFTPLMAAVEKGDKEMVSILVDHGANLNPYTRKDKMTALMMAIENSQYDIARYLIEKGAWINMADREGRTALFYAVYPDVNIRNADISNPKQTTDQDKLIFLTYLIEKGADLRREDDHDHDILSFAIYYKQVEAVKLLREHGLKFRREDKNKDIPGITEDLIYQAISCRGNQQLAYFLAVEGNLRNPKELDKAAAEACNCGLEEIYIILTELGAKMKCEGKQE